MIHLFCFNQVAVLNKPSQFFANAFKLDVMINVDNGEAIGCANRPNFLDMRFDPYLLCKSISADKFMCAEDAPEMG